MMHGQKNIKSTMSLLRTVSSDKYTDLTFGGPRIVIYSYNKSQQDATLFW